MEHLPMKTTTARLGYPFIRSLLFAVALLALPVASLAAVFVSVAIAPPALPVYTQPVVPGPGYIWTPGYWAYGPAGYYWVPGTWVLAPYVGALWTPGYWGWGGSAFIWHGGYWGPHVGYYGGINYGFGYAGVGYLGGSWNGRTFSYNSAVTNVNVTNIHNTYSTYNRPVVQNNAALSRVSYNGGAGGITAQPTAQERLAERDQHLPATQLQLKHQQLASTNRAQLASMNHGTPSLLATPRAAAYKQANVGAGGGTHLPNTGQPHNVAATQNVSHNQAYVQHHPQGQGQPHPQEQSHPQVQQHGKQAPAHHEENHH
jgi:WXXGXW repeat (2 copies)